MPDPNQTRKLIDKRQLLLLVPLSYSTIYAEMRGGNFPLSVRSGGRVFWYLSEIEEWLAALPRSEYGGKIAPCKSLTGADQ